jgi:methionyl aminopeptidase
VNKVPIKSAEEIEQMREACQVTAIILDELNNFVKAGISTEDINTFVHRRMQELEAKPSTLNYRGYPKSCCTSVNDVVCHGIPSAFCILNEGDIINIDVTSYKNGFHGDSSRMYFVGGVQACKPEVIKLVNVTKEALLTGISVVKPDAYIGDIGAAIQEYIYGLEAGYGIVKEYTGHGVGREFHEPPQVLHVGRKGFGERMRPGMTFTIEPMINQGTFKTVLSKVDGWTVRTADGGLSAQWEHTVLVTDSGYDLLTKSPAGLF